MVAARSIRSELGMFKYESLIKLIDWNRVLIEARGIHLRTHGAVNNDVCGSCLQVALLADYDELG